MPIVWTQALSLNIPEIDEQHRELFSRIAALQKAMLAGKGKTESKKILAFLEEYANLHFGLEERYMDFYEYPDFAEHNWEHRGFRQNLAKIQARLEADGPSAQLARKIETLLGQWFSHHIDRVDKRMGIWLSATMANEQE